MKNLSNLILEHFFLRLASLEKARQSISCSISFSLIIIELEIVFKKLLGSADLTKAQAFHIHELTKVIMGSKNNNLVFAAFQVMVPSHKSFINSQ